MILLIDNYDSFSYNLFQLVGELSPEIRVVRNDELTVAEIDALAPSGVIISPGPGRPEDAGVSVEVVKKLGDKYPILGVCLGHQAICVAFGTPVIHAERIMHGKQSEARLDLSCPLFEGMPETTLVARYHSLAADKSALSDELKVVASTTDRDEIMAVQHKSAPIFGLQFHPESILTPAGKTILRNFVRLQMGKGARRD